MLECRPFKNIFPKQIRSLVSFDKSIVINIFSRFFYVLVLTFIWTFPAIAQLKPEAMVLPIGFVGINDKSVKVILQQHVLTVLSESFELKSENEVISAREKAVDKISSADCSEITCLQVMGELLDVDYMFAINITASGDYWDLSGIRLEPLGKTLRKSLECTKCNVSKARSQLTELCMTLDSQTFSQVLVKQF